MPLTPYARRTYHEARYQRINGRPSKACTYRMRDDLEVWMTAFDIAEEENLSPWDALMLAVRRRAARVRAVDRIINTAWEDHRRRCEDPDFQGNPEIPDDEVRKWMVESRNEERLMARTAKMAIDAGVADALVRRLELEGQLAVDAMLAGLDELNLTVEQRMKALSRMHSTLMQLPPGPSANGRNVIPGVVVEDDDDDKRGDDT